MTGAHFSIPCLLCIIALLGTTFDIWIVNASEAPCFYIKADGSIDPPTPLIQRNGDTYTLTGNIIYDSDAYPVGPIIGIERNNTVLDGAGCKLQMTGYNTGWGTGIATSTAASNITIGNLEIEAFGVGIMLGGSLNNVTGNKLVNNGLLTYGKENTVENTVVNGKPLVYLEGVSDRVVYNAGQVILVDCNNIEVENLDLSNATFGVELLQTNNCKIRNNNFANDHYGIALWMSSNNTIAGNRITNCYGRIPNIYAGGISLGYSNNNRLYANNITACEDTGISLSVQNSGNSLNENYLEGNNQAIEIYNSSENSIIGNEVRANRWGIVFQLPSKRNVVVGNNIVSNEYGVSFDAWAGQIDNRVYHNNFVNNTVQARASEPPPPPPNVGGWDDGYPSGGNYWSDYVARYANASELDASGIWNTPYSINVNNVDRYPLILPWNPIQETNLLAYFRILSGSCFGNVQIETMNASLRAGFLHPVVSFPANKSIDLMCTGRLEDYNSESLEGKEVKLLVDDTFTSSYLTTDEPINLNWTVALNLPLGVHNGELKFEGDELYEASSHRFTILAYKDSQFNITKDAFSFSNWEFSFSEFGELVAKLSEENVIDQALEIPLLILYPLVSYGGHCFGMAAGSAAYYLDSSLKPRPVDAYALANSDALWDIDWYQLSQLWVTKEASVTSSLSGVESLLDSGTPVVLGVKEAVHAITLIGYCQGSGETFLVAYDNDKPNFTVVYTVEDGKLMYGSTNVTSGTFTDPHAVPPPFNPTEVLKEIFQKYIGLQFHSPVDINITSTSSKQLLIENNTVLRNDFDDSYIYLADNKIILLPLTENCTMEITGTDNGQVSLDCVFTSGDQIVVHQSQNITISNLSKLYLPTLQSSALYVDSNGDGTIDQTIIIPELSSLLVLLPLMISTMLVIVIRRRHVPSKRRNESP